MAPTKEDGPFAAGRGMDAVAASQGGDAKHTEFRTEKRDLSILDAAGLEVLNAWRYFSAMPGDLPAIVAALLVVAWAVLRGRP